MSYFIVYLGKHQSTGTLLTQGHRSTIQVDQSISMDNVHAMARYCNGRSRKTYPFYRIEKGATLNTSQVLTKAMELRAVKWG